MSRKQGERCMIWVIIIGIVSRRPKYHSRRLIDRTPIAFKYANKVTRSNCGESRGDKTYARMNEERRRRGKTGIAQYGRSEWWGFVMGSAWGIARMMSLWHSYMKPLLGGSLSVAKPTTYGQKRENFFIFLSFRFADLPLLLISWHDACRPNGCGKWWCIINE